MEIITSITAQPRQRFVVKLENNNSVNIYMYYYPTQKSWYYDLQYSNYTNNGNKVVLTMNSIRHLKNRLPFGIAFVSASKAEPFKLTSFSEKEVLMCILNETEVQQIEDAVYSE